MSDEDVTVSEEVKPEGDAPPAPPDIKDFLSKFEGAPSSDQIQEWKAKYGEIFVFAVSETELFIFRAVDRKTWTNLQRQAREVQDFDEELSTVQAVLLWASVSDQEIEQKAGITTSLHQTVMEHSHFMPAQIASMLTIKL